MSLRGGLRTVVSHQEQDAAFDDGVLDHNLHQGADQRAKLDFSGKRARGPEQCVDVKLLQRHVRGAWRGASRIGSGQMRIRAFELPYLGVSTPPLVAITCIR